MKITLAFSKDAKWLNHSPTVKPEDPLRLKSSGHWSAQTKGTLTWSQNFGAGSVITFKSKKPQSKRGCSRKRNLHFRWQFDLGIFFSSSFRKRQLTVWTPRNKQNKRMEGVWTLSILIFNFHWDFHRRYIFFKDDVTVSGRDNIKSKLEHTLQADSM